LIKMAKDAQHDEEAIHRHLESLKAKLENFIHKKGSGSGGASAS
jgi:hypothetical protein